MNTFWLKELSNRERESRHPGTWETDEGRQDPSGLVAGTLMQGPVLQDPSGLVAGTLMQGPVLQRPVCLGLGPQPGLQTCPL